MNIIFLSDDPREADLLKRDLAGQVPSIHVEVSPNTQDAVSRTSDATACDAILLDTSIPREDAVNLVAAIRRGKKPIGIVALADTADKNPPIDLFKAGVDNFILKRSGYVSLLGEALKQANERHKADSVNRARHSRIFYAGDIQKIQPQLSGLPHLTVESVAFAPDGLLKLPEIGSSQDAVLVIDFADAGTNALNAIKDVNLRAPEIPIILLTEPGDEETAVQAMRAGAVDCIVKSANYFQRLLPAVEREAKRWELARDRTALRAREERLRQIVESMPVGVTVIAPDGTFLAINRTGLKLVGAGRLDQIVGKNFVQLLSREEREKILDFLKNISRGVSTTIHLDWKGLDGTVTGIELRAVPMRRDAAGANAVLAAIFPSTGGPSAPATEQETQKKYEELNKALLESETRYRELQNKGSLERSKFEELLQQIESRSAEAEEQQALLKHSLQEAETRYKGLLDEQKAERAGWEQAREALKEQCAKIESMAQSLRTAQEGMIETHRAEQTQWESKLQELENRRRDAEEQLAHISESFASSGSKWDAARLELERKAQEAEKARAALESALLDAEARLAQQAEELNADRARLDSARLEFEQKVQDAEQAKAASENSLSHAGARFALQAEELNAERSRLDSVRSEFERKIQDAEQARAVSEVSLRDAEARLAQQAEEFSAEQSRLDSVRSEFEQKVQDAEQARAVSEVSLRDAEARLAQQAEEFSAERSRLDSLRLEFEQKVQDAEQARAASEASLRDAEARITQQAEVLNAERSRLDSLRLEFEQKIQDAEQASAASEASLRDSEARITQQAEEFNAERSRLDSLRLEFEQKIQDAEQARPASEASLRDAEARLAQQAEALNAERSQRVAVRLELEQKIQSSEEQRAAMQTALHEAESLLANRTEEHNAERAQWDAARLELEQKQRAADGQRAGLQIALDEVESYLSQQLDNHNSERSQWNCARLELEQKCLYSEEQRAALQSALQEAEPILAHRIEEHNAELAQWNAVRLELEQKCQNADLQHSTLKATLQESESRCAQMAEEIQNKSARLNETLRQVEQLQSNLNQLRDELADLHLRYQTLSQLSSAGVVLATLEGQVLNCNDSAARMFGYSGADEARSQTGEYQFGLYSFEGALKLRLLQDGKLENVEWSSLTRDGRLIRIQESSKLVVVPSGENTRIERILTDISKIHRLGEEIRRARRMESTTDLATATIKSLQELCASLANRGDLLIESADDGNTVRSVAEGLRNDAKRGMKHARQFFSAIQKADRIPELLNLNEVLASNDVLLHNLVGEDIDLQTSLSPRVGLVSANRKELVQLISNLMASSREALPLGGAVVIETSNIETDPLASACPANMPPGTYVLMMIAADGCSVHPERRIGSIQTIVERMGGWLETANNTQAGNTYKIYLPRVEAFAGQTAPSSKP